MKRSHRLRQNTVKYTCDKRLVCKIFKELLNLIDWAKDQTDISPKKDAQ